MITQQQALAQKQHANTQATTAKNPNTGILNYIV
jgi:hypothetical protein